MSNSKENAIINSDDSDEETQVQQVTTNPASGIERACETVPNVLAGKADQSLVDAKILEQAAGINAQITSTQNTIEQADIVKNTAFISVPKDKLDGKDKYYKDVDIEKLITSPEINVLLGEALREAKQGVALKEVMKECPVIRVIYDKLYDSKLQINQHAKYKPCSSSYAAFINTELADKLAEKFLFPKVQSVEELNKYEIETFFGGHKLIGSGLDGIPHNAPRLNWLINPIGMYKLKMTALKDAMIKKQPNSVSAVGTMHKVDKPPSCGDFIPSQYECFDMRRVIAISDQDYNSQDGAFVAQKKGVYEIIRLVPLHKHYLHHRVCFIALLKRDYKGRLEVDLTIYNKDSGLWQEVTVVCEVITFYREFAHDIHARFRVQGDFNTYGLIQTTDEDGKSCQLLEADLSIEQVLNAKLIRRCVYGLKQLIHEEEGRKVPMICCYVDDGTDMIFEQVELENFFPKREPHYPPVAYLEYEPNQQNEGLIMCDDEAHELTSDSN